MNEPPFNPIGLQVPSDFLQKYLKFNYFKPRYLLFCCSVKSFSNLVHLNVILWNTQIRETAIPVIGHISFAFFLSHAIHFMATKAENFRCKKSLKRRFVFCSCEWIAAVWELMKKIAKKKSVARNKITFLNVHRLGAQLLREREREKKKERW